MELKFLGRGSMMNISEGNNAAYFIDNDELFLIDSGYTVIEKVMKNNLLNNIKNINILITHLHFDHMGSLGALIEYSYNFFSIKPNIIVDENVLYKENLIKILDYTGVSNERYNIANTIEYEGKYKLFNRIEFIKTEHVDILNCYGIKFYTNDGIVYYTGDSKTLTNVLNIIKSSEKIDKLYIDVTTNKKSNHVYIFDLINEIPKNYFNKIYIMHINNDECIKIAKDVGINVVEVMK